MAMAQTMSLMASFSQPERFTWHDNAFTVMIPNGNRTAYHARASQSDLRALLMPQLRLTRGGNISQHQPDPPAPQPYDFYLAQLIHYGLDFHFEIEMAQRALEIELRLGRLRIPPSLQNLERELERAHKRAQKKAHEDATKHIAKQQPSGNVDAAISIESSEKESEDEPVPRPGSAKQEKERNKQKIIESSTESEESSEEESSSDVEDGSDKKNDTIIVAPDRHDGTSSSSPASTSSSEEVQEAKRPSLIPPVHSKIEYESSETDDEEKEEEEEEEEEEEGSIDDDPFLERQDVKRIKLEKADEHEDPVFRSTRATAPLILRKQPPPSQAKVRRIASHPQIPIQPMNTAVRKALDSHSASVRPASASTNANRKPFFSPDKRPSWTIPVRSSPSSAQKDSPKSVTFSQAQRETPSKVPNKEKTGFSSTLKTPQGTPHHRRTASASSDHGQLTPLRSILKKATANPNTNPTLPASNIARPQISVQVPHNADTNNSARQRRRKRKSGTEERLAQDLKLDGTLDAPDASESSHTDKPFIVSDIVNGKPISSQQKGSSVKNSHRFSVRPLDDVVPGRRSTGGGNGGFMAVDSNTYQQQQQAKKAKLASHMHTSGSGTTPGSAPKARLSMKGGASVTPKLNKKLGLGNGQHSGMGSGSRGSLVRAGRVY
jgi:hypothetical protein